MAQPLHMNGFMVHPAKESDPRIGQVLGNRYRLLRVIGEGSTGIVYEAVQAYTNRRVALKIPRAQHLSSERAMRRFHLEARLAACVEHPNVVRVLDFRNDPDEVPFLVMELLEGESLRQLILREGSLTPQRATRIFLQVLSALAAAHRLGIVHRDIKPSNIVLTRSETGEEVPKLVDFGIAQSMADDGDTNSGTVLGTLAYMAPEQAAGRPLDARVDVYAVGASLFQCVSGRRLFPDFDVEGVLHSILTKVPARLDTMVAGVDAEFAEIVACALQKRPDDRYAGAEAMASALAGWFAGDAPSLPRVRGEGRRQATAARMQSAGVTTM